MALDPEGMARAGFDWGPDVCRWPNCFQRAFDMAYADDPCLTVPFRCHGDEVPLCEKHLSELFERFYDETAYSTTRPRAQPIV
jgi:hypothetical protein